MTRPMAACLAALRFSGARTDALGRLSEREWREALDFCDRARLTLFLAGAAGDAMPEWVRERVARDAVKNRERLARLEGLYREVAARLSAAGIEFLALKGITHSEENR